jgi:hypothetical protein
LRDAAGMAGQTLSFTSSSTLIYSFIELHDVAAAADIASYVILHMNTFTRHLMMSFQAA